MSSRTPQRYPQSSALAARGAAIDASIRARAGVLAGHAASPAQFPVFADRAKGAFVYDVDGNRYLDFVLAFGAVLLGHSDSEVDEAVIAEIRRGVSPSLLSRSQLRLAELITQCAPGAEMVSFLRTGSDATAAAVRIARAFTGRRHVLQWGYHGWHEWCATRAPGLISEARALTSSIPYGNPGALEVALRSGDVACVMMMPFEVDLPPQGYLQAVRELCTRYGALLILDEVRSGFRLGPGGAQAYFGVQADLAVFSKAMANGYAISAVAGAAKIMQIVAEISMSSTFFRSCDGMAAALATIARVRKEGFCQQLWHLGERLQRGVTSAASVRGVPALAVGLPPMPHVRFAYDSEERNRLAMSILCEEMLVRGVLLHPNHHWFVCAAMTESDIDMAVAQFDATFSVVRERLET
jgi:glutamate-1-semialdehyde 2,1-aminomutase